MNPLSHLNLGPDLDKRGLTCSFCADSKDACMVEGIHVLPLSRDAGTEYQLLFVNHLAMNAGFCVSADDGPSTAPPQV